MGKFDQIAARRGFPIDLSESERGMRKFVSKWREQPAPFGMGSRTRLHGEFERREDQPGWSLRFHIERQAIRDISVGFDPQDGDWEDGGQDFTAEQTLLGQLRLAFGQKLGIDPSFEQSR